MRDGLRAPRAGVALAMVALPTVGLGVCGVLLPLRLRGLGVAELAIAVAYLSRRCWRCRPSADRPLVRSSWRPARPALGAVVVRGLRDRAGTAAAGDGVWPRSCSRTWSSRLLGPALAQLSASLERGGAASGVALGLFNVSWAIFQVVGSIGGAELSRVGVAVPFLLLSVLFVAGARATSRLAPPPRRERPGGVST